VKTITLECENGGERLDVFLADNISGLTRSAAQKLLETGRVTLGTGNVAVRKNHRTSVGDVYMVLKDEPELSVVAPQDIPLDIIYEDADLIVINKPRGMVVHPAPGHSDRTLVNALLHHCGESLSGIGGIIRPGVVHRIDKDTSGLIIAAKNDRAHVSLASQLSSRTLLREYEAIVCGNIKNENGTINAPIGRHPTERKKQAVYTLHSTLCNSGRQDAAPTTLRTPHSTNRSRPAITHYTVVTRFCGYTHIHCRLETGRTHQIRVHMASIGYPILGDIVYGRKKPELGMSSQCLHARKLCFTHPSTKKCIELYADLPDYFVDVLAKLEKRYA
jgi:23S rRNA pseudouridine1911/1915/1917 synthase